MDIPLLALLGLVLLLAFVLERFMLFFAIDIHLFSFDCMLSMFLKDGFMQPSFINPLNFQKSFHTKVSRILSGRFAANVYKFYLDFFMLK